MLRTLLGLRVRQEIIISWLRTFLFRPYCPINPNTCNRCLGDVCMYWNTITENILTLRTFQAQLAKNETFTLKPPNTGKTGVPGEKPLGARTRTNNKLNPHLTPSPGIVGGLRGRQTLNHCSIPAPSVLPCTLKSIKTQIFYCMLPEAKVLPFLC